MTEDGNRVAESIKKYSRLAEEIINEMANKYQVTMVQNKLERLKDLQQRLIESLPHIPNVMMVKEAECIDFVGYDSFCCL